MLLCLCLLLLLMHACLARCLPCCCRLQDAHLLLYMMLLTPAQASEGAGMAQVTPILGMLSLIQVERLSVREGKLPRVHLVWATRNAGDFLLLDQALVDEAKCAPAQFETL